MDDRQSEILMSKQQNNENNKNFNRNLINEQTNMIKSN